jgi:hypothetical protein
VPNARCSPPPCLSDATAHAPWHHAPCTVTASLSGAQWHSRWHGGAYPGPNAALVTIRARDNSGLATAHARARTLHATILSDCHLDRRLILSPGLDCPRPRPRPHGVVWVDSSPLSESAESRVDELIASRKAEREASPDKPSHSNAMIDGLGVRGTVSAPISSAL